jgi:hypothetical protein
MNNQNQDNASPQNTPIVNETKQNLELPTVEQLANIAAILLASNSKYETLMNKKCDTVACKAFVLWSACHNVIFGDDYNFIRDPQRLSEFASGRHLFIPPGKKVPLADVLCYLMPGLGEDASYPIFRRFLKRLYPEMEASKKMEELKKTGELKGDREYDINLFKAWRANEISEERRKSGSKSASVRKKKKLNKQAIDEA